MKIKLAIVICFLGVAFGEDPENGKKTTVSTTTTTSAPSTSTTVEPSTTASTTTSSTSTTSQAPTSTSTLPPTTSIAPSTTHAPPGPGMWMVKDPTTNIVCILAKMEAEFSLHLGGKDVATTKLSPGISSASGDCSPASQKLLISWPSSDNLTSSMLMLFSKKGSNYFVSQVNLTLVHNDSTVFVPSHFSGVNLTLFETSINSSYSCGSISISELKNEKNETVSIKMTDISVDAFRTAKTTKFADGHYCNPEVPDIVPLVVGIALAALVLVVVVAYLIGRRRSQARGYLSM